MPRNFVTVNGTVNIDGAARQKDITLFSYGNGVTPDLVGRGTSRTDGTYSISGLKERGAHIMGIASSDYGPSWLPSTAYTVGQKVLPKTANNHWYTCTTAGTSDSIEPNWVVGGDFTIECWLNRGSDNSMSVISKLGPNNDGFACITRGGAVGFMVNGFEYNSAPNALASSVWYHVAWVMTGGTMRIYVDGTIVVERAGLSILPNNYDVVIAADKGTGVLANYFNGYIDSVRITKGVARYSGNSFSVPTKDFPSFGPVDPLSAETKSLMRFDGSEGSRTFEDEKGFTWSAQDVVTLQTNQYKFGGSSAYFNNSYAGWMKVDYNADFNLNGDWTIETFFRLDGNTANVTPHIFEVSNGPGQRLNVYRDNQGNLSFYTEYTNGASGVRLTYPISPDTWYHVALVRSSAGIKFFVNGNLVGTYTGNVIPAAATAQIYLGNYSFSPNTNDGLNGWIDEFRFTRAVRYTSSFTVPTTAYPRAGGDPSYNNVASLLKFDDSTLKDEKGLVWTYSGDGGPRQWNYKFPPGSLYLVGSGAMITPSNDSLNLVSKTSFPDGTAKWIDGGLVESPIARGPFQIADPVADTGTIFLTRNHEQRPRDEISGSLANIYGTYSLASSKFAGLNSINFDGSTGGSFYPALSPGSGDWTVEGWFFMNTLPPASSQCVIYIGDLASNNNRLQMGPTAANGIEGFVSASLNGASSSFSTANPVSSGNLIQSNTWYHIAFEKFGNNTYLYLNGTQVATATLTANYWMVPASTANTYIGTGRVASVTRFINGRVGEVRVSNVARYQGVASFQIPTAPYTV
ncbi:LamG domain-containing protein [Xanthomonas phage BUDD]|nr:LamG domain-containing protein [Xanthomonas phage BUDD]